MSFYLHIHHAVLLGDRFKARIEQGEAPFADRSFVTVETAKTLDQICGRAKTPPSVIRVFAVEPHNALKQARAILSRIEAT
jgi:hypothetical protein